MFPLIFVLSAALYILPTHGEPCDPQSLSCLLAVGNRMYRQIIASNNLNQIHVPTSVGSFSNLQLTHFNPTLTGLMDCTVADVTLDLPNRMFHVKLSCPRLIVNGTYQGSGRLLDTLEVNGRGDFIGIVYGYEMDLLSSISIFSGADHRQHVHLDRTSIKYTPRGSAILRYSNAVNGNVAASAAAQEFLNRNAIQLLMTYQKPLADSLMAPFLSASNRFFSTVALDDVIAEPRPMSYMDTGIKC